MRPPYPLPPTAATMPVAVDLVVLTVTEGSLHVLLVERALAPDKGLLALPGGFLLAHENLADAARRELCEETGITPPGHLEQLRSYGPLNRDPRGPVLSVAYLLFAPTFATPQAGGDAAAVQWHDVQELTGPNATTRLAFDHSQILADGVERARAKIEYSPLATAFCPPEFTIAELRSVYEAVWGCRLDPRNFHRKATKTAGFLEATGRMSAEGVGRPAALYRLTEGISPKAAILDPPLSRPDRDACSLHA